MSDEAKKLHDQLMQELTQVRARLYELGVDSEGLKRRESAIAGALQAIQKLKEPTQASEPANAPAG